MSNATSDIRSLLNNPDASDTTESRPVADPEPSPDPANVADGTPEGNTTPPATPDAPKDGTEPSTEEGDSPWFQDEEFEIIYKTDADARRGLVEKEKFIRKLKQQQQEAEQARTELQMKVEYFEQTKSETDTLKERVASKLPEKFQNVSEEDILDETELREFIVAKARAEAEVQVEDERRRQEFETQRRQAQEKEARATEILKSKINGDFFGLKNSEEKAALYEMLEKSETVDGVPYTPSMLATMAYQVHPEFGDLILEGVRARIRDARRQHVVEEVRKTATSPEVPAQAPPSTPPPVRGLDAVKFVLGRR